MRMQVRHKLIAAIVLMAAIALALVVSGCVTRRDVEEINQRLDTLEIQNVQTQKLVAHMDSVIAAGAEADRKTRADINSSVNDLQQGIAKLLENYNDLLAKVDALGRSGSRLRSSPGATDAEPTTTPQGSADCQKAYDDAFVLARQGKYEPAIAGFQSFLGNCPNDPSAENAYFWIGECYYSLEKYSQAVTQFDYVLKNYKGSANTSRALYKLARSKQELGQKAEARKTFQQLITEFPKTLEAEQAKDRLKELK